MREKILVLDGYARNVALLRAPLLQMLAARGHEVLAAVPAAPTWVLETLQRMGVRHVPIDLERSGMNPLSELASLRRLVRLLRDVRADVLLSYTIKPVIWGSTAARVTGGVRAFSFVTGLGHSFIETSARGRLVTAIVCRLYRMALARNQAVFFQNLDDLSEFRRRGLLGAVKAIVTAGSGIDLERFPVTALPERAAFILVGRLLGEKGIREYAAAARILKPRYPEASFRLLGPFDSNPSALSPDEVRSWQAEGIVEYLGEVPDVRRHLSEAGVFVLPSYREGLPRSALEAMAMARPIIVTDVPGCREVVVDGDNGFKVAARDPAALARAMERFLLDPGLMLRMGRRSRAIAEQRYDVADVNQQILRALALAEP
jgi:glycosyltransferase involved in cell wall biosynthesis